MADADSEENSAVAVYRQHSDAEQAINLLKQSDFNIKKLAYRGQGLPHGRSGCRLLHYGDRVKHWGKMGAFWGGLWGMLVGAAFFMIPGIGPAW